MRHKPLNDKLYVSDIDDIRPIVSFEPIFGIYKTPFSLGKSERPAGAAILTADLDRQLTIIVDGVDYVGEPSVVGSVGEVD